MKNKRLLCGCKTRQPRPKKDKAFYRRQLYNACCDLFTETGNVLELLEVFVDMYIGATNPSKEVLTILKGYKKMFVAQRKQPKGVSLIVMPDGSFAKITHAMRPSVKLETKGRKITAADKRL